MVYGHAGSARGRAASRGARGGGRVCPLRCHDPPPLGGVPGLRHLVPPDPERARQGHTDRAQREQHHRAETAQERLQQQWHIFDTALSHTPDFTYIFDLEGRFTYANRALLSLWQKPLDEAVGKNFFDLDYPPELAERLQRQIQQVIDTNEPVRDHTPFTGPTGETREYEYIFVPVLAANGQVEAVAGSTRDVTQRKQAEEQERQQQAPLP